VRHGIAHIPYPGGCKIGARGYDLHLMVWQALGCVTRELDDHIEVTGKLKGGVINFPISTVGGTENALICASVATGTTEIHNAYITPEIQDLMSLLRLMGAKITNFGNSMVRVTGCGGLLRGASYSVIPDRIEALTWIVFAAITGGEILIEDVPFKDMEVPLLHLKDCGIDIFRNSDSVYMKPECLTGKSIQPFELACGTHPGIISDMQPFYVLLGLKAKGISRIFDYRYPDRIAYIDQLNLFCDKLIKAETGKITTQEVQILQSANVHSTDLRGSMAILITAFCAQGKSKVRNIEMAMRGYNNLLDNLKSLGLKFNCTASTNYSSD
jgi:UDP-N-acetylglucosamine 1-carboxyvinyltransferase